MNLPICESRTKSRGCKFGPTGARAGLVAKTFIKTLTVRSKALSLLNIPVPPLLAAKIGFGCSKQVS